MLNLLAMVSNLPILWQWAHLEQWGDFLCIAFTLSLSFTHSFSFFHSLFFFLLLTLSLSITHYFSFFIVLSLSLNLYIFISITPFLPFFRTHHSPLLSLHSLTNLPFFLTLSLSFSRSPSVLHSRTLSPLLSETVFLDNSWGSILRQQPEICPETILSDDTLISNVTHLQSVSKNTATIGFIGSITTVQYKEI